jgi:hypothetical protein
MMSYIQALAIVLAMLPVGTSFAETFAHARDVIPGTALHQYIGSQEHLQDLAYVGLAWDIALNRRPSCESAKGVRPRALMIYSPVKSQRLRPIQRKGFGKSVSTFNAVVIHQAITRCLSRSPVRNRGSPSCMAANLSRRHSSLETR